MNVFVIPSWYPSQRAPINGVFIKEQVEAIGKEFEWINMIVSSWGHLSSYITGRSLVHDFKSILWVLKNRRKAGIIKQQSYIEIFNPSLTWTLRKSAGGLKYLESINEQNLKIAIAEFGKIDLIHAHVTFPAGFIALQLSKKYNIPYIITEHMGPFPFKALTKNGSPINEITLGLKGAQSVIAVSDSLANSIKKHQCPEPVIIPNYVDEKTFFPKIADSSSSFIFFCLSDISLEKGIDKLIMAFSKLDLQKMKCELWIGGNGKKLAEFKTLAEKLNISDKVKWLHGLDRDTVPSYFQQCNCFVMPSRYETFGIVYAEAIACGKPIIATRCGGPESIVNESNGLLVDIDDVSGLSLAMEKLYFSIHKYDSKKIREDFLNRFSKSIILNKIVDVYRQFS